MLKKRSYPHTSIFSKRINRLGIVLLAILLCAAFLGFNISQRVDLLSSAAISFAQASSSVFGVEANPFTVFGGANLITQTQTSWVRGPVVNWNDIETTEGTYNWSGLGDALAEIQLAVASGIEPIVVVRGTPAWAQNYAGYTCGPIDAPHFSAFGNFMVEMITNSPLASLNVKYWEFWNEPDLAWEQVPSPTYIWAGCWGEASDTQYFGGKFYGDMLGTIYPLIKAADPQAQVLVGGLMLDCDPNQPPSGLDCTSSKFLEGILNSSGANAFDGISYHAYDYYGGVPGTYANTNWHSSWLSKGPSLIEKGQFVRSLLQKYNISGKYLLNTENALLCATCTGDPQFEQTKAFYVAEAYASAIAQDLLANIWFSVRGEWGRNNGLLDIFTPGYPPLPAYHAYKFAAQELSGGEYVGKVNQFPGLTGYEFAKSDRHVWLVWSPDGTNVEADFLAVPLNVYDVDGDAVSFSDSRLTIGREPYYVELPASLPRLHLPLIEQNNYALSNGGFENGQSGWTFSNNGLPVSIVSANPINPATGAFDLNVPSETRSALLGDTSYPCTSPGSVPIGYAEIRKTITVPNNANQQVWLDFYYIIYSQDASTSITFDRFEVYIQDAGSPMLRFADGNSVSAPLSCINWRRVPGPENIRDGLQDGWALGSIDLTANKGHDITIYFRNYSRYDNYYNTYTYLDNIQLREVPIP